MNLKSKRTKAYILLLATALMVSSAVPAFAADSGVRRLPEAAPRYP